MNSLITKYREYLAANQDEDPRSDVELTLMLGDRARTSGLLDKQPEDFVRQYYSMKEAAEPGFLERTKNAAVRGYQRGMQSFEAVSNPLENAESIAERQQTVDKNPTAEASQQFAEAKTTGDSIAAFMKHPLDITSQVIVESLGASWPAMLATMAGGAIGGAVTSETGPGAAIGTAAGAFAGSGAVEFSSKVLDSMIEAGMDIRNPDSIREFFSDEDKVSAARVAAVKRAIPVAAFDAATAGLAGRFIGPIKKLAQSGAKVPVGRVVAAGAKELGMQAAGGSLGELGGQLAAGENLDGKAIAMEAIAELGTAPYEVYSNIREVGEAAKPKPTPAANPAPAPAPARPAAPIQEDATTRGDVMRGVLAMSEDEQKLRFDVLNRLAARTSMEDEELRIISNLNAGKPGFLTQGGLESGPSKRLIPAPDAGSNPAPATNPAQLPVTQPNPAPAAPAATQPGAPLVTPDPEPAPIPELAPEAIMQKVQNLGNRIVRLERRGGDPRSATAKLNALVESGAFTREGLDALETEVTAQENAAAAIAAKVTTGQANLIADKAKVEERNLRADLSQRRSDERLKKLREGLLKLTQGPESGAGSAPNPESSVEAAPAPAPAGPVAPLQARLIEPHQEYTLTPEQSKTNDWDTAFKKALGLDKKAGKGAGIRKHGSNASQSTVGVALLDTATGEVHLRGLLKDTVPILATDGTTKSGLAVQGMGKDGGSRTAKLKVITPQGAKPALLSEVVQAGLVPIGRVNFESAGKINQTFPSREAFIAAANTTEIAATKAEETTTKTAKQAAKDVQAVESAASPAEKQAAAESVVRREKKQNQAAKRSDESGGVVYNSEVAELAGSTMDTDGNGAAPVVPESSAANRYGDGPWEIEHKPARAKTWKTIQKIGLKEKLKDTDGKKRTRAVGESHISETFAALTKGKTGSFRVVNADGQAVGEVTIRREQSTSEPVAPSTKKEIQTAYKLLSEQAKGEDGTESIDWLKLLKTRLKGLDESQSKLLLAHFLSGTKSYAGNLTGRNFAEIVGPRRAFRILNDTLEQYDALSGEGKPSTRADRGARTSRRQVNEADTRGAEGSGRDSASAGAEAVRVESSDGDQGGGGLGREQPNVLAGSLSEKIGEATRDSVNWTQRFQSLYTAIANFGEGKFSAGLVSRFPEKTRALLLDLVAKVGEDWDAFEHFVQNTFDVSQSPEAFAALMRGDPEPEADVEVSKSAESTTEPVESAPTRVYPPHEITGGVAVENTVNPIIGRVENPNVLPDTVAAANYNLNEAERRGRQVRIDESAPADQKWTYAEDLEPTIAGKVRSLEAALNRQLRKEGKLPVRIKVYREGASSGQRSFGVGNLTEAVKAIGRLFGKDVVFYSTEGSGNPDIIYRGLTDSVGLIAVDIRNNVSALQVVGHELVHGLARQRPDLFNSLTNFVDEWAPMPADYAKGRLATGEYVEAEAKTEWVADVVGERFAEPEFWSEFQQRAPAPTVMNVATWIGAWVRKIMGAFRKNLANTSIHVRNLARLQETVADVMAQYAASAPYAEQLKGEVKDINKSATREIEYVESEARVQNAAWNAILPTLEQLSNRLMPRSTFEEFWRAIAKGDTPQSILENNDQRARGTMRAAMSDVENTPAMKSQMIAQAYKLARRLESTARDRAASASESMKKGADALETLAKKFTKSEKAFMDADAMQATMFEDLKELLGDVARDIGRIGSASFVHGEVTATVREIEGLSEKDAIPEDYQKVFRQVMSSDGTSIFDNLSALAQLNLPLKEMTAADIVSAMGASGNAKLVALAKNRPLAVALSVLARNKQKEMDLMQLRLLKDTARSLAIKQQLEALRSASDERIEAMWPALRDMRTSQNLADRLQAAYIEDRRKLRRAQSDLRRAGERERINRAVADKLAELREEFGKTGGDFATWVPADGATYTAMRYDSAKGWVKNDRTLRMAGTEVTSQHEQLSADLASNRYWMQSHEQQRGTPLYNLIEKQTMELANIDVSRRYESANRFFLDKLLTPIGQKFAQMGGAPGQLLAQMFQKYQFITKNGPWHDELIARSKTWTKALQGVTKASGYDAPQHFFREVYDHIVYNIESNPGREEDGAIRDAVRDAVRRIPTTNKVAADFGEKLGDFLRKTKGMSEYLLKVAESNGVHIEDREVKGLMRNAIQYGWMTVSRSLRTEAITELVTTMKEAGWSLDTFTDLTQESEIPLEQRIMEAAERYFTPDVVRLFVTPFVIKPGKEVFFGADRSKDRWSFVSQLQAQAAWQRSNGDVLKFIDTLFEETYEPTKNSVPPDDRNAYRVAMLTRFRKLFSMEASLEKKFNKPALFDKAGPLPHRLMDGRTNDIIPPEHFKYDVFDTRNAEIALAEIGFHAAFGRNMDKFEQARKALHEDLKLRSQRYDQLRGVSLAQKKAEALAKGWNWDDLKTAHKDMARLDSLMGEIGIHFGGKGLEMGDERAFFDALQTQAALVLNQPTSGLWNIPNVLDFPILIGLGPTGVSATGRTLKHLLKGVFGSALGAVNINLLRASAYQAEITHFRHGEQQELGIGEHLADVGRGGRYYEGGIGNRTMQASKFIQNLMKKGVKNEGGFVPFNGLWAPFNFLGEQVSTAIATANVENFELMIKRAIDFFRENPDAYLNPAYRLTAKDLKMVGPAFFTDERAFDYYRNKAYEYGMGGIEDIAREAGLRGGQILKPEQVLSVTQMAMNEISLESSINSRPIEWTNNPILRYGGLLLGWPIAKMHQVNQSLKTVDGRKDLASMARGIATLAAWSLPLGLAFSFMMDDWDEDVLGKKSNRREIDKVAGVPVIGPILALTAGERGFKSNAFGMLERAAKAGNVYGLGADMVNSMVNVVDPSAGQRDFSLDSRVLAFSQWANLRDMFRNYLNQGGTYTYESVGRPLLLALGGNGVIQAQQIINKQLDLDNTERWIAERISVGNYLRSAGREIGLELKAGAGRSSPTPVSVWEREMYLAAIGNDRMKFLESYRAAVAAARNMGEDDPENAVLQSWRSRNPLASVFRYKPTDDQTARLLGAMNDSGREAVRDVIRLYDDYTQLIEPSQFEKMMKRNTAMPKVPTLESVRRQAASLY